MDLKIYSSKDIEKFDSLLTTFLEVYNSGNKILPYNLQTYLVEFTEQELYSAIDFFEHNGLIRNVSNDPGGPENNTYEINTVGLEFIKKGSFKGEFERQKLLDNQIRDELKRKEIREEKELQQIQSIIDTNNSVQKTNKNILITGWLTVLIVAITLVVTILQYCNSNTTKDERKSDEKKQIKDTENVNSSINDSTIKPKILQDSVTLH